ncbi:Peptide-N(4)-(N-acetyl-beta-glucosaminyl)asparagine amidase [Lysobacter dokdonensis DS-58]|uniref:Peptide-N(4)-(N-acetyl-beta-glucosaminyl)asparagine amidase n=1 Tax=Lysobacter dokdonensis DS-58 TaxID=1300345 RepID=A0A0A2X5R1_9GAMM|nr:peptide-N4-asparagine amidase [Lysobacter dokdonensis]KGQ20574.1 Peptide-N(4)-(N-acetyl-beta-glucosaminyl)asparagine amidase [Lysobacter dokdonensis DS-58]
MNGKHLLRTLLGSTLLVALASWGFVATRADDIRIAPASNASRPNLAAAVPVAALLTPAEAGADPFQVEPRVPRAAGSPCVVTLFRERPIPALSVYDPNFNYTPPAACPGPWSKVKLIMQMSGPRQNGLPTSGIGLSFVDVPWSEGEGNLYTFFVGAPQIHNGIPTWVMERDVTEYASILRTPKMGFFAGTYDNDNFDSFDDFLQDSATVQLVFYQGTPSTPAQRIADLVVPVMRHDGNVHVPFTQIIRTFPRNIERAYLDVIAHVEGGGSRAGQERYWWACAPDAVITRFPYLLNGYAIGDARALTASLLQGCGGGNYREVEIRIDGRLAGLAPVYPWLGSAINNNFRNTIDIPAPGVQALNRMPHRVDLTPFAGLLNNGVEHVIEARIVGAGSGILGGNLLLYLDRGRAIVPGAVTRNTLVESTPTVTDTLSQTTDMVGSNVNHHLTGQVVTRSVRSFRIDGYVDTSRGRITSSVIQRNYFLDTNIYDVTSFEDIGPFDDYDADFGQKVRLTSSVDSTSRRLLGSTLLSEDKLYSSYPFVLDYRHAGGNRSDGEFAGAGTDVFSVLVHQGRVLRTSQFRRGTARYTTSLSDLFDATRDYRYAPLDPLEGNSNWASSRDYLFTDNRGGCYSAGLTTMNAELQTRTRGDACGGTNTLRWWSHPDGSPDSMNWAPAP